MTYSKYELTDKEQEKLSSIDDNEPLNGSKGWDYENDCSNAATYARNCYGQDTLNNWTEQKLNEELEKVIRKTAFNIVKTIPFETKKKLFLQYKSSHHTSRPKDNQNEYDTLEDFCGISNYLLVHKLTINEAKKLFQASLDVEAGTIELKNDFSIFSEPDFINFIG